MVKDSSQELFITRKGGVGVGGPPLVKLSLLFAFSYVAASLRKNGYKMEMPEILYFSDKRFETRRRKDLTLKKICKFSCHDNMKNLTKLHTVLAIKI